MWADILIAIGVGLYGLGLWWAIDTLERSAPTRCP